MKNRLALAFKILATLLMLLASLQGPQASIAQSEFDLQRLDRIDTIVNQHILEKKIPGCVVAIGNSLGIAKLTAYGNRQLIPDQQVMTEDTVFDLASLTKPVATASAIICLIEDGQLRLNDRISEYLPAFAQNGKDKITVRQLLVHTSGLIPDNPISDYEQSPETAWQNICQLKLSYPIGTKFSYTDVGFIVLAKLVERLSGKNIDAFTKQRIFEPLEMRETQFNPPRELRLRAAPTEKRNEQWLRGEVHDPRAFRLNGIAGHAGLFSTARDLSRFARMMLNQGSLGPKVLSPRSVQLMTAAYKTPRGIRGLGWDIESPFSSNRSDLYSDQAFGHGGFTGTSIWIDPGLDLFVIVLSNRVHPDGKGRMNKLAARVGSIAVSSLKSSVTSGKNSQSVELGIDVLASENFRPLQGKKIGLITNHTGINSAGTSTVELIGSQKQLKLVKLFSPEHGFKGTLDQAMIADSIDQSTGLKVVSLYGEDRKPKPTDLADIDVLIFDIQDIGTRFYTYISTMGLAMQAASDANLAFMVLDRPNPIGGEIVNGPMADADKIGFTAYHNIPVRHGMTIGELALMFNQELHLNLELSVIQMKHWRRKMHWDQTGLFWVNPSPNMRSPKQALLYPGIGLLEFTNVSVGRGTDTPFECFGAPWMDSRGLAKRLNAMRLGGIGFTPVSFTPHSSKFQGKVCEGIQMDVFDRNNFRPLDTGIHIATVLREKYQDEWDFDSYIKLLANQKTYNQVRERTPATQIIESWQDSLRRFKTRRAGYLLYD